MRKRILSVIMLIALSMSLTSCLARRAQAISNMRVMPDTVDLANVNKECVAFANTGQCQVWIITTQSIDKE